MSTSTLLWVIGLSAAGTFLIRYLPMMWRDRGMGQPSSGPALRRALDATGPSAIVALLAASFWDMIGASPSLEGVLPIVAGLMGVVAGRKLTGTIAGATLAGVVVYGLLVWALTGL